MSGMTLFTFEQSTVRVVILDGDPWFILSDVCKILEISNTSTAAGRLKPKEKRTLGQGEGDKINGLGSTGSMPTIISEQGLYRLIMRSDKPQAEPFQDWVTGTVLPSIRKTGGFMVAAPDETPEELALRAMAVLQATVARQKEQLAAKNERLAVTEPRAAIVDRMESAEGSLCITHAAKVLKKKRDFLIDYMKTNSWIYKRQGASAWAGYQARIDAGLLEHRATTIVLKDGRERFIEQVVVTAKGMTRLAAAMNALDHH